MLLLLFLLLLHQLRDSAVYDRSLLTHLLTGGLPPMRGDADYGGSAQPSRRSADPKHTAAPADSCRLLSTRAGRKAVPVRSKLAKRKSGQSSSDTFAVH